MGQCLGRWASATLQLIYVLFHSFNSLLLSFQHFIECASELSNLPGGVASAERQLNLIRLCTVLLDDAFLCPITNVFNDFTLSLSSVESFSFYDDISFRQMHRKRVIMWSSDLYSKSYRRFKFSGRFLLAGWIPFHKT